MPRVPISKKAKLAFAGLFCFVLLLPLVGWLYAKSTLPSTGGTVTIAALKDDVEIVRDAYGVPHIFAPSWREAYIALGYLHAEDRLWQMELTRRLGAGRLAEIAGERALATDKLMRTLNLYQLAADSYFALSTPVQAALQAYAEGVNAYIATGNYPLEFRLGGITPAPWHVADSLVWIKIMASTLSSQWRRELTTAALAEKLPPAALQTLLDLPVTATAPLKEKNPKDRNNSKKIGSLAQQLLHALPPAPLGSNMAPASASNAWAIGPARSSTGAPVLVNDPHLMLGSPALWYMARIETPEGSVVGATAPGLPFHVMGMNNDLAWGLTTTGADVADVFIETYGNVPELYRTPHGLETFMVRHETIAVKDAPAVTLKIRHTRHGPVIGDLVTSGLVNNNATLSLQATFLRADDTSAEGLYWLARAKSAHDVVQAARFVQSPVQNIMFAESRGTIGMITAGVIPVRGGALAPERKKTGPRKNTPVLHSPINGSMPSPGDDARYDWVGIIPRHELPQVINPAAGVLGNANEAVVDSTYPYFITSAWDAGFRGQRLQQLLASAATFSPATAASWLNDTRSLPDLLLRDRLLALLKDRTASLPPPQGAMLAILADWQGQMDLNEVAPTILAIWQEELARTLLADDLGTDALALLQPFPLEALLRLLADENYQWCDNNTTDAIESCADAAQASLAITVSTLSQRFGNQPKDWTWDKLNIAPLANRLWDNIPLVGALVSNATPVSGGQHTLHRAGRIAMTGDHDLYNVQHGAAYRALYDLANPAASGFMIATGQSGHIASPHYSDLVPYWASGQLLPLTGLLSELQENGGAYLTLKPDRDEQETESSAE